MSESALVDCSTKLFSSYYFGLNSLSAMNGITLIRKPIGQMMKIGSSRKDFETSSLVHQFDKIWIKFEEYN